MEKQKFKVSIETTPKESVYTFPAYYRYKRSGNIWLMVRERDGFCIDGSKIGRHADGLDIMENLELIPKGSIIKIEVN